MSNTALAILNAVTFVWLGVVLGISFLEAPLKFRAPGVTIQLGLGIGRIVFRALNIVEVVLALTIMVTLVFGTISTSILVWSSATGVLLLGQLLVIRPRLNRRSDRVLAGEEAPRSQAHLVYIALEILKVAALLGLGISALTV